MFAKSVQPARCQGFLLIGVCIYFGLLPFLNSSGKAIALFETLCILPLVAWLFIARKTAFIRFLISPLTLCVILYVLYSAISQMWGPDLVHYDTREFIRLSIYSFIGFLAIAVVIGEASEEQLKKAAVFVIGISTLAALWALSDRYIVFAYPLNARLHFTGRIESAIHGLYFFAPATLLSIILIVRRVSLLPILPLAIFALCFFMSQSRGPMLALFVAALVVSLHTLRSGLSKPLLFTTACLALLVAVSAIIWGGNRGTSLRPELWALAFEGFLRHPIIGNGNDMMNVLTPNRGLGLHAHNIWMSHLYWGGLLGVTLFALPQLMAIRNLLKARHPILNELTLALFIYSLIALLTYGNVVVAPPGGIWFAFIVPMGMAGGVLYKAIAARAATRCDSNHKTAGKSDF